MSNRTTNRQWFKRRVNKRRSRFVCPHWGRDRARWRCAYWAITFTARHAHRIDRICRFGETNGQTVPDGFCAALVCRRGHPLRQPGGKKKTKRNKHHSGTRYTRRKEDELRKRVLFQPCPTHIFLSLYLFSFNQIEYGEKHREPYAMFLCWSPRPRQTSRAETRWEKLVWTFSFWEFCGDEIKNVLS